MKKIEVQDHWKIELQKLRCWLSGFNAGRKTPGETNLDHYIPGQDTLRQIILAIDDAKDKSK
jgi:hypothetical protein